MRRITDVRRERLGIPEEALEAYGKYKAKISLDYLVEAQRQAQRQAGAGHGHLAHARG